MKWEAAREIFGVGAVVASLVFVGIEVKQNTSASRGQTRQDLAALNQEWLKLLSADAEFSELFTRAWVQWGQVTPEEEERVQMMMLLNFRRLENVFFQYQEGLIDKSGLASYGMQKVSQSWLEQPRFKAWWSRWQGAFHPDFVEYLQALGLGRS